MIGDEMAPFFAEGEFAQAVTIGAGQPVAAIFEAAYGSELDMDGLGPALRLPTAACSAVVPGTTIVQVGASSYIAARHEPDGSGVSILRLRLA